MRKTCLIFNAAAGSGSRFADWLRDEARIHGMQFLPARQFGEAEQLAFRAAAEGCGRIIVAGGDGTIHQVVNGAAAYLSDIELAIVPLGTGNDLARSVGVPLDDVHLAFQLARCGTTLAIDLLRMCGPAAQLCVNAATGGVGAKVAADVKAADKALWGSFAYWMTAISELAQLREYKVRLEVDDQVHELPLYGLVVANGRYVGGGFSIAPTAALDDGWLNITAIPVLPTLELLAAGLSFTFGRPYTDRVPIFRARRVHIVSDPEMQFSVDGEPTKAIDSTFEVMPQVLRVVVKLSPE